MRGDAAVAAVTGLLVLLGARKLGISADGQSWHPSNAFPFCTRHADRTETDAGSRETLDGVVGVHRPLIPKGPP